MQAGDEGKSGSADGQDGQDAQAGSGASDCQGGPEVSGGSGASGGPCGSDGSGSAEAGGSAAGSALSVVCASGAPASSTNQGLQRQIRAFVIRVTFPSHMAAEIARRSLAPFEGRHLLGVPRELTVTGNILVVRWITGDRDQFQYAFTYFLEQLYLVVQTLKRRGQMSPTKNLPGKGV
ncbi:EKC/KEOPS complex subunit LAGE3-like [Tamandua tetradactyla]|uniref:EKC/KEOPS complex subunit LAGE3-like n=1 Tax=Tamandua tetradactyla TaxID=48850 RepID=UPI0040545A2F